MDVVSCLWVLDISQHVVSHSGLCTLHCQALGIVEIGRHSHDRDIQQPVHAHDGPRILQCPVLEEVEVGKRRLDCAIALGYDGSGEFLGLIVQDRGPSVLLIVSESGILRRTLLLGRHVVHRSVVIVSESGCLLQYLRRYNLWELLSYFWKACSEESPGPTISARRSLHNKVNKACLKRPVGKGLGQNAQRTCLTFRPRGLLPNLHELFFFFSLFFVLYCFCNPAVVVHEVVFCLFLRFLRF